jgi:hypothetical protein
MPLSPEATFDALYIADRIQNDVGTFSAPELHLFAYLACLLWLYRGRLVEDWGYHFVGTELGAPFSVDIDDSVRTLIERGYMARVDDRMRVSDLAEQQLQDFGRLALSHDRVECLNAACSSTAAFSHGMIGSALAQEPDLRRAQATPMTRPLLEDLARSQLFLQFDALRKGLQEGENDLRMPAVVWLSALYRSNELPT